MERQEVIKKQEELWGEWSCFPGDGRCFACKADLVQIIESKLVTQIVTGCPICRRSFCD